MIRFYMDENVHGDITDGLRRLGIDVLTVQEDHRTAAPDPDVLDRAGELNRVLFSQDEDLVAEAVKRQRLGSSFAGVVYAKQARVPVSVCVQHLSYLALAGNPVDFEDQLYFLPL